MTANAPASAAPGWDNLQLWFRAGDCAALRKAVSDYVDGLPTVAEQQHFLFEYTVFLTGEAVHMGLSMDQLDCCVSLLRQLSPSHPEPRADHRQQVLDLADVLHCRLHPREKGDSNYLIARAKVFIHSNLHDKLLDLEQISAYVGLSKNYFCMLFHQATGVRFGTYLKQERLARAKQLLRTTHMKVFEISEACGFSSAKYFSYTFRQAFGCTPLEYQKQDHIKTEE